MKLRGYSTSHFIQVIRNGLVMKVHNVDSRGRPGIKIKKLENIIGDADAEDTLKFRDDYDGSEIDSERANTEITCLPFADRKTREKNTEIDKCNYSVEDDGRDRESDELSTKQVQNKEKEMTLRQLKEKYKTKKRKASESVSLTPKPEFINPEEDDCDLMESLSSWKAKHSKSPKSKKKRVKKSFSPSSDNALSVKSEQISDTEDALLSNGELFSTITIKAETPEPEYFECRTTICVVDDSLICNEEVVFCGGEIGFKTVNREVKSRELISITTQGETCVVNDVADDHFEHIKPSSLIPLIGGENVVSDDQVKMLQPSPVLPVSELKREEYSNHPPSNISSLEVLSPTMDHSPNTCNSFQNYPYPQEISEQVNCNSGVQDSYLAIDNDLCCMELDHVGDLDMVEDDAKEVLPPNQEYGSLCTIVSNFGSTWTSHSCSSPDNEMVSVGDNSPTSTENQPLTFVSADAERGYLNSDNHLVMLEDSSMHEENQPLISVTPDAEGNSSAHNQPCDVMSEHSVPEIKNYHCIELRQSERLPSTRKAISPTSQEKLCLAMKSAELLDEMDDYKCKEKLYFGEQAENKSSPNGSDVEEIKLCLKSEGAEQVIQNKATISPKQILKKPKNEKKGSPPKKCSSSKGCLDGPRLCRSLPRLSTGCTSIQACSESAIAFSQRQMHDIESLALKLMTELKTMKGLVEEKLLYEAYRSISVKNEADEVKLAIKTATKTEETARKWLSMMARDCNRFCKIMRLTEGNAPSSENTTHENSVQRERKKISFADEAGGVLCDVKFFENGLASAESTDNGNH